MNETEKKPQEQAGQKSAPAAKTQASGRYSLAENGRIFFQPDASNPLPGHDVDGIKKGEGLLTPATDQGGEVQAWLQSHIKHVLAPLVALKAPPAEWTEPVRAIAEALYTHYGVVPRPELEAHIAKLTPEDRHVLRTAGIRLGPLLIFMPDLNKPAAVRLKATLWALWNDKGLPIALPKDGVVSQVLEGADPELMQLIGYPVYGGRVVRIDMLDRVVSAVYDSAQGGKFQAQHQMAEWLGCGIEDLYKILEALGHTKIEEPAAPEEKAEEKPEEEKPEAEKPHEEKPQEQVKPPLAIFRLKKGKASGSASPASKAPKKPSQKSKGRDKKSQKKKPRDKGPRIITAEAKSSPEDSPFAVLQQLKNKDGN